MELIIIFQKITFEPYISQREVKVQTSGINVPYFILFYYL